MNKRILIIGGSGLLGSYLTHWFIEKGYKHITATYHQSLEHVPTHLKKGIHWEQLTLPDKEKAFALIEGHDWVIHTAGYVSYNPKHKDKLIDINTMGTAQVVNACLAHKVEHLIYIGSKSVLGREKNNVTLDENASWLDNEFSTSYGLSKYLGELEVWRGLAEGLNASVILPAVILGTGNWNSSSLQMIHRIASKSKWYPGGKTGFVDVRDVVMFISLLLEGSQSGERWLLNGFNNSYKAMYHDFANQLDLQVNHQEAPKWLAKLKLKVGNLLGRNTLGPEMLNQAYGAFDYDASKSLGIDGFSYTSAEKSISEISAIYASGEHQFLDFS
jgi:nucleoside-diphosphate-sugar epimerase